jgi:hypothetical protein
MPIGLPARVRSLLLVAAVFCFAAPNGYFLYRLYERAAANAIAARQPAWPDVCF